MYASYAPDEIERFYMTNKDDEIRRTDLPERVQERFGDFRNRVPTSTEEYRREAEWIFDRVYGSDRLSAVGDRVLQRVLDGRNRREMIGPMTQAVRLLRWEVSACPFATHCLCAVSSSFRILISSKVICARPPPPPHPRTHGRTQRNHKSRSIHVLATAASSSFASAHHPPHRAHVSSSLTRPNVVSQEGDRVVEDEAGQKEQLDCSGPREVPFIAQYRKELVCFPEVLNMHDLWLIKEWDEKVGLS
jgi:hypothetical protein